MNRHDNSFALPRSGGRECPMTMDMIREKLAEDNEAMEAHFEELVDMATACAEETRGDGEWVACDEWMPEATGEHLVKGYGMVDGVRKEFLTMLEPEFHVENYWCDAGDRWTPPMEEYDVVADWDVYCLREAGYTDIHVTHWMQYPDDWDWNMEVL